MLAVVHDTADTPNRMSSREVAELTGKNHADVMRDIRSMHATLTKANLLSCVESDTYVGADLREYPMYQMDKETTICLLTGYDAVSRMKVVQRWNYLENRGLPQTKSEALRQLADAAEREEALVLQLAQAKPAVEFYEQVSESKDAIPVAEAAKLLEMGPLKLFAFLRREKIFMDGTGGQHRNMPYQTFLDREYFKVKETVFTTPDGQTHINAKPLVLQKGLDYIRKRLTVSS